MALAVDSRLSTPITELRSDLDKAERMLPQLDAANVGAYLAHLDRLQALFAQVDGDDADLRSELTRWSDLQAQIAQRASAIVRAAGGATSYRTLRAQHPPAAGTWWHLDGLLAAQRRRQLRTAITLGVVAVVLIVATLVYRTWLAPSPEVILQVSALHDIESAAMAQDWATAYAIAQSTLETLPDDSQLLVWAGVIAEQLGDTGAAAAYLARARAVLTAEPLNFHLSLAQTRFQANDLDRAVEAAKAAEAVAPDDPRVAFVFGSIAEAQGHLREAIQHFERVASLAEDSDPQLAVMSKMRMATLLQSLQMNPAADEPSAVPGGTPIP